MRLDKYHFEVSADGLATMIRHLRGAEGSVFTSLQVEVSGDRFRVALSDRQLAALQARAARPALRNTY